MATVLERWGTRGPDNYKSRRASTASEGPSGLRSAMVRRRRRPAEAFMRKHPRSRRPKRGRLRPGGQLVLVDRPFDIGRQGLVRRERALPCSTIPGRAVRGTRPTWIMSRGSTSSLRSLNPRVPHRVARGRRRLTEPRRRCCSRTRRLRLSERRRGADRRWRDLSSSITPVVRRELPRSDGTRAGHPRRRLLRDVRRPCARHPLCRTRSSSAASPSISPRRAGLHTGEVECKPTRSRIPGNIGARGTAQSGAGEVSSRAPGRPRAPASTSRTDGATTGGHPGRPAALRRSSRVAVPTFPVLERVAYLNAGTFDARAGDDRRRRRADVDGLERRPRRQAVLRQPHRHAGSRARPRLRSCWARRPIRSR